MNHDRIKLNQLTDDLHQLRGEIQTEREAISTLAKKLATEALSGSNAHEFISRMSDIIDHMQGSSDEIMDTLAKIDDLQDEREGLRSFLDPEGI
jgi:uncharacterized coiled-coil DUF342 family protein